LKIKNIFIFEKYKVSQRLDKFNRFCRVKGENMGLISKLADSV